MNKGILALTVCFVLAIALVAPLAIAGKSNPTAAVACKDGIDNDGDGYKDWPSDPGCSSKTDKSELNPNIQCDDGIDNDKDGLVDYNDAGCSGPTDNDETNCGDGVCEGGEVCDVCMKDCGYCDTAVPTVIMTAPANTTYSSTNITLTYTAWDSNGVSQCKYELNGATNVTIANCINTTFIAVGGSNRVKVWASDTHGNWGVSSVVYFTVDTISCTDTDGGNVITVFGTTYGYLNNNPYSHSDYCVDSSNINEYYCYGNYEQSQQQSCGTDGYVGGNYCMNGDVYRNYTDYSCIAGTCVSNTTAILQQDCLYGCTNGVCNPPSDSCSDTDGGFVVTVNGTVSGYSGGSPYEYTDFCITNSTLMEYYCSGNIYNSSSFVCTGNYTGCFSGKCL